MINKTLFFLVLTFSSSLLFAQPEEAVRFVSSREISSGLLYAISSNRGFLVSADAGQTWQERNSGLPARIMYPFTGTEGIKPLTSFAVDPSDSGRIVLSTSSEVYLSENGGSNWTKIPVQDPVKSSSFITSLAFSPKSGDTILVGTSFSGLYITESRGKVWKDLKDGLGGLYRGAGFYEDISGIAVNPASPSQYVMGLGFGNGIYRSENAGKSWVKVPSPLQDTSEQIKMIYPNRGDNSSAAGFTVLTDRAKWLYYPAADTFEKLPLTRRYDEPLDMGRQIRLHKASNKFGIYLHPYNCDAESLGYFFGFMKTHGLNSIVVDMKDDMGRITYDTDLELPKQMNGLLNQVVIKDLVDLAHKNGIYVIGRVVVFKDRKLFYFDKSRHALWDFKSQRGWGNFFKVENEETDEATWEQREFWLDPFDPFVWDYNISVAKELQDKGIDEIQFDYIRFPSDGDLSTAQYRYRREGQTKIEALESFLRKARESITIPISTDLYGFNCYFRMGNWIGQSVEYLSRYVDVISPMFYPSHFPRDFMQKEQYLPRAKKIYLEGSNRAAALAAGRSLIRPYVQAFLLGGELDFDTATYSDYLVKQLEGTKESEASGFTLWNNSNKYYMVKQSLLGYTGLKPKPGTLRPDAAMIQPVNTTELE